MRLSLTFRDRTLRVLPVVCAEALQPNAAKSQYDIVVIVAYNDGIAPFLPQVYLFRALIYLGIGNRERASVEFSKAHNEDPRNVFVLLRWANTLRDLARESKRDEEHQAARICAEQAKEIADRIIGFDNSNEDARQLLEELSDEFDLQ